MGKHKKLKHLKAIRNVPLGQQMAEEDLVKPKDRQNRSKQNTDDFDDDNKQNVSCYLTFNLVLIVC